MINLLGLQLELKQRILSLYIIAAVDGLLTHSKAATTSRFQPALRSNDRSATVTEELGYQFHSTGQTGAVGHPQLDINLYKNPTQKHFDPERVTFWVVAGDGQVSNLTITHPWRGQMQYQVCAGRIILHDRKNKVVEAFSLGGVLEITVHDTHTSCCLISSAPIVHLTDIQDVPTNLASEFEVLLAQLEARWGRDESGFKKKLANIEPLTLFVAGLMAIQARLHKLPATTTQRQSLHAIDEAIKMMQTNGNWPASIPILTDLLK